MKITCTLGLNERLVRELFDTPNNEGDYIFDELGLVPM